MEKPKGPNTSSEKSEVSSMFPKIDIDTILTQGIPQDVVDEIHNLITQLGTSSETSVDDKKNISKQAFTLAQKLQSLQGLISDNRNSESLHDEMSLIIGQVKHLLQPLTTIHSIIRDLDNLDESARKFLRENTLPSLLENKTLIDDMQRAASFIPEQLKLLDKLQREGVGLRAERIGTLVESVFNNIDIDIRITGKSDKNINMVYLSLILQNIATNYQKYAEKGSILIELGATSYDIFTENTLQKDDAKNPVHSGGEGQVIMQDCVRLSQGEIKTEQEDDYYSLSIKNMQYRD